MQRSFGSKAGAVDRTGDSFLARARFPDDENRKSVASRLCGDRERCAEVRSSADQLLKRQRWRELFGDGRKFTRSAATVGVGGQRFKEALGRNGAHKEVGS